MRRIEKIHVEWQGAGKFKATATCDFDANVITFTNEAQSVELLLDWLKNLQILLAPDHVRAEVQPRP